MGKGEDLNEEFFAVTDERFLTQQKLSLLICWDFVSKPCELLRYFAGVQTLVGCGHFFSNTEPLVSNCWQSLKLFVCKGPTLYQSVHENVSESPLHSLFLHKTIQLSPFEQQSTARCPPFYKLVCWLSILTVYDICHIFHELQHSLARLQHRYYDVTILMG